MQTGCRGQTIVKQCLTVDPGGALGSSQKAREPAREHAPLSSLLTQGLSLSFSVPGSVVQHVGLGIISITQMWKSLACISESAEVGTRFQVHSTDSPETKPVTA